MGESMPDLKADFEQLKRAAGGIGSSAEETASRLASFQSELASYGEPWKDDPSPVGELIGAIYGVISQAALEAFGDNAKEMGEHARKVGQLAQGTETAEDLSALEVNHVRDVLG